MSTPRTEVLHSRHETPLVVRGRLEKSFRGLGVFAGVVLMLGGSYLVLSPFWDPLSTSDMAVLTGSFSLALACFLLVFVLFPRRSLELAKRERDARERQATESRILTVFGETVQNRMVAKQALHDGKNLPGPM